ncbi:hypothetical protein SKAU_G00396010 [Synaphobranchus kaupii]|uniref:GB1/RHD3-type G domain-containing protein n=1 Tax=Synaphobranchus kaupii TaxID=118154 RepID=A0A9Q1ECG7_SYNKA|nr:hypothetical protein SKAU_G00396010 [Synaphobranchus kaupii]
MASEGPIRLVECSWDGKIGVNPEAIRILSRIPPPLRVVSIFGPRQSGKSYLLNVLAGSTGFTVSKECSPNDLCINMWTLPNVEEPGHTLVLLDTEGFDEDLVIEGAAFTCPVFTLSLLLSSVFLYNTWVPVTMDILDQLLHVTTLTNQVSLPAIGWAGESLLPQFVWCVRDFEVDMAMGDVELMPEDFLDSVLNDAKGLQSPSGIICELFSQDRVNILDFCRPQHGADSMDEISWGGRDPRFTRQVKVLKRTIFRSDPKVSQGRGALSGRELGAMLEQFVDSMSRGSPIQLDRVTVEMAGPENVQEQFLSRDHENAQDQFLFRDRENSVREERADPYRGTGKGDRVQVGGHPGDMQKPVCLIANTNTGELQVDQEALDILRSIGQPVVVVSIVGLYRTGKSYLMNRLAGKQTGFSLGSTVQDDVTLVLLDTEGLGDVEKGDQKNDTWIFSLAVLLSSTLVYNSIGNISNDAVMSLHYVTELTEHIKVKSTKEKAQDTSSDYMRFFPTFVWAVRDFTLELKLNGKTATADEYLENSLKLKNGTSKAVALSNDARECIRNYFPDRKCFVFDQPGSKEKLKVLDQLRDSELDPQFVKQTSDFCSYVFGCSKEKTIKGGIIVTGSLLGNLAVTYVDAIRSGSIPCLENAVAALSQIENSTAVEESFALYRRLLGERVKLHTETEEELSSVHDGCLKEALQLFMNRSFKDEDHKYQETLMERVKQVYEGKCAENAEMSQNHCAALLLQLENDMDPDESYMRPGGYQHFKADLNRLVNEYKSFPAKGVKAEQALEDYLSEKNQQEKMILTADRNLSEQQRRLEEQQAQVERESQRAAAAREQQRALERRMNDMERAHRENERQLRLKMERDRIAANEENQRVIDQKLREQRALFEQGYREKAEKMNADIRHLKNEISSQKPKKKGGICVLS